MTRVRITIPQEEIEAFCQRHHICWLTLFGSVLCDDLTDEGDVDVLVEFEPDHVPGFAFFSMQRELSEILGQTVDLNTPGFLSQYFREEVLNEAETRHVTAC